ncbi:MAG: hypothetical protein QME79_13685, partial [Bacillota bacterium]|nr:hypothetical protein [Bacillota bacterium]
VQKNVRTPTAAFPDGHFQQASQQPETVGLQRTQRLWWLHPDFGQDGDNLFAVAPLGCPTDGDLVFQQLL